MTQHAALSLLSVLLDFCEQCIFSRRPISIALITPHEKVAAHLAGFNPKQRERLLRIRIARQALQDRFKSLSKRQWRPPGYLRTVAPSSGS